KFKNEKIYKDSVFPSTELRLLSLSRYWNIINYFFPYKYLIGQNWNDALTEMIPKFAFAKDTIEYHLAMRELVVKINDSHASLSTKYTKQYFGLKWVPFQFKIINDKAVVTGYYNDSLCKINDIKIGDVFMKVNNMPLSVIIQNRSKYISGSNESTKLRNYTYAIFNGSTDSVFVSFERNGVITNRNISRYYFELFKYKWTTNNGLELFKILDNNIGYVNMGLLKRKHVKSVMTNCKNTRAIIFDLRNYPNGTMYLIANHINAEKRPFVKFTNPDISFPGIFHYTLPYYCGRKNKNNYKGKIILLFNETTQSHAEFTLMALETAPNVKKIGSQTAGADGNVSMITFPGNYNTYISAIGVYYPNGRETQRIGIVPDIEVKPTIEGIIKGKDEVLEKAMEYINGN
ncbi:MAG: S41 family peptidase, partial [Bacteroidota bacterium]